MSPGFWQFWFPAILVREMFVKQEDCGYKDDYLICFVYEIRVGPFLVFAILEFRARKELSYRKF